MSKYKVNFYYSPLCSEALITKTQLDKLFSNYTEYFEYRSVKINECDFSSIVDGTDEFAFFEKLKSNKTLLMFARLFIDGSELKMPKLSNRLKEFFSERDIRLDDFSMIEIHGRREIERIEMDKSKLTVRRVDGNELKDMCHICSHKNRYIFPETLDKVANSNLNQEKVAFIESNRNKLGFLGFVEYYDNSPVAMIEGYNLASAYSHGLPVVMKGNSVMITCLHISAEADGNGISKKLIESFIEEAKIRSYDVIQVVSYQDDMNWQPESLYVKFGFKAIKELEFSKILELQL